MNRHLISVVALMLVSTFLATGIMGHYANNEEMAPINTSVSYEKDENGYVQEFEELIAAQQNAIYANGILEAAFGCDEDGLIQYPDEYAGVWLDEDILVISLVEMDEEIIDKYMEWLGDYSSYVRFEKADYSYNYLQSEAEKVAESLKKEGQVNVFSYYVDPEENEIVVGVEENLMTMARTCTYTNTEAPISFVVTEQVSETSAPLYGGEGLYNVTDETSCLISCCGTYNGKDVIVTCGHGNEVGDVFKLGSTAGVKIGSVTFRQYVSGGYGDFSVVPMSSFFYATNRIKSAYKIVGTVSNPPKGTVIRYFESATANNSYAKVTATGVTSNTYSGNTIKGITEAKITDGSIAFGASGSPIFTGDSNDVKYCGVLHGFATKLFSVCIYFTPYYYLDQAGIDVNCD